MGKIIIVGDLFPVPSTFGKFSSGDIQYLFGDKICQLFADADYRICNMEGALTDNPGKCEKTGAKLFAPTATIEAYKQLAFDCCALANNHITDAGPQGVLDTMKTLDTLGIQHIGVGENEDSIQTHIFFNVRGKRFGLYNVAETMYNAPTNKLPGAHLYDEYVVCKDLESIKSECDYLIVLYHGGTERYRYPSPQIQKRFHRMVDSGADMILSQHTHCVGSEEYYKGAYLLYGQGNFLFRSFNNEFTDTGLIIELDFDDQTFVVKKHLVDAIDDTVRYDEKQDFTSFYERSERMKDEGFIREQYKKHAYSRVKGYLNAYKGNVPFKRLFNHFFPKQYEKYLLNSYNRNQLLLTLHSLRSEQNREMAMTGIFELMEKGKYKKKD